MMANRNNKGMSSVEFALVLPVFMMLLFGIVEFGTAFYKQQVLTSAAREAARIGIVAVNPRPTATQVKEKALSYLDQVGLDSGSAVVNVSGAGGKSGDPLSVEIAYPASFVLISNLIGDTAQGQGVPGETTLYGRVVFELE